MFNSAKLRQLATKWEVRPAPDLVKPEELLVYYGEALNDVKALLEHIDWLKDELEEIQEIAVKRAIKDLMAKEIYEKVCRILNK